MGIHSDTGLQQVLPHIGDEPYKRRLTGKKHKG